MPAGLAGDIGKYFDEFPKFIDDLDILFTRADRYRVRAFLDGRDGQGEQLSSIGDNHREAAVRLYVKLKLGDQFEVPESI